MLSRIFWISVAGIALIAGMAVQERDWQFGWTDRTDISAEAERKIGEKVERAVERSFDGMQVVSSDGQEIDVPSRTKRDLADAVGRLVKAETDLALARIGEDDREAVREASARRDVARADVDRLKGEIKAMERSGQMDPDAVSDEIRREIREDIRATVRDAVQN